MWKRWNEYAPISVRLAFGGGFAFHGYVKLFAPGGHESFVCIMKGFGIPAPGLMAWFIGGLEFFGGLALLTGTFVATTALALLIELAINVSMALSQGGFPPPCNPDQPLPGYQSSLLYMSAMVALILGGSGAWSVTRLFVPRNTIS